MAFDTSSEAKKAGWHSRRHQDAQAHSAAATAYLERDTRRVESAQERQAAAAEKSARLQLKMLDNRCGVGQGATRERAKLQQKLEQEGSSKEEKNNGSQANEASKASKGRKASQEGK